MTNWVSALNDMPDDPSTYSNVFISQVSDLLNQTSSNCVAKLLGRSLGRNVANIHCAITAGDAGDVERLLHLSLSHSLLLLRLVLHVSSAGEGVVAKDGRECLGRSGIVEAARRERDIGRASQLSLLRADGCSSLCLGSLDSRLLSFGYICAPVLPSARSLDLTGYRSLCHN